MKGTTPTRKQKAMWTKLAEVGCICCLKDGRFNPHVSIHHISGRTSPGAHDKVLPLCGFHHQQDDRSGVIAVHPNKARFQQEYGDQYDLLEEVKLLAGVE